MPFLAQRLDVVQTATEYLRRPSDPNTLHILDAPFLFTAQELVVYFRTLNYSSMSNAYQYAGYHNALLDRLSIAADPIRQAYIASRMKPSLRKFLMLEVRREHLLEDTFNQLWGREKRELMRPMKVRMGMDQGEEGVDHGGVSQEFFRLVFARAFDPEAQLFTIDPRTRTTWFDPMSREPLPTYEMLGLLVSLAIYNGITLPVTFPIAFYTKLLGRPVDRSGVRWTDTSMLTEGWLELAKGMQDLLYWSQGDVADVFVREYAFSVQDNFDTVYNINMQAIAKDDPRSIREIIEDGGEPLESAPTVTNATRQQFVQDYTDWLIHRSIAPQFDAFARGFHTCLDPKALRLLTPSLLRDIAEGYGEFSILDLKAHTKYEDGYTPDHPFMATFWSVATSFSKEQQKALLEFVTASDRVPVTGMQSVQFYIVRNGPDSELLPTSMTCFGKLLLPEYGDEEKLRRKLEKALEHSKGFGTA
jgi:HECT-domain (ubiquitin-transferase)